VETRHKWEYNIKTCLGESGVVSIDRRVADGGLPQT
jgi:hypothetical protein